MGDQDRTPAVELSVVVPVFNEEAALPLLFARLYPVLDGLGVSFEALFVDDGSRDGSPALLRRQHRLRPEATRVLLLRGNAGQHAAIMAGFQACAGRRVVTLDADLQTPPEEIPRLLAEMERGHDYVGSVRRERRDARWRDLASRAMNRLREGITEVRITDQGSMLRGYAREVVDAVLASGEGRTFIPALAYLYARSPTEIEVAHAPRSAGESKYPLRKLVQLNYDLITGFSLLPLQAFSLAGIAVATASLAFLVLLAVRGLLAGPGVEAVFALFGILSFLCGLILFGIGVLGEYVGRLYQQSRGRPAHLVAEHLRPRLPPPGSPP
jgi:undecaprenyl-phosphate 4-deoxy-4-formamido-L-arabinose transferase